MLFYISENQRNQLKSFKSLDHLNESIRGYLYKFKKHFYNQNFKDELNAVGKVFKFLYTRSINPLHVGISYWSNKKIAKELDLNIRTVKRAVKKLVTLRIIIKVHTKRMNGSDTSNTYVILPMLSSVVDKLFKGLDHPTQPLLKSKSFNQVKQVKDIYIDKQLNEEQHLYIEQFKEVAGYVAKDYVKKAITINNQSSFLNKLLQNLNKKALYEVNMRIKQKIKQQEQRFQTEKSIADSIFNANGELYDWLED